MQAGFGMDEGQVDQIARLVENTATRDEILAIADNREKKYARMLVREGILNQVEVNLLRKRLSFDIFAPLAAHEFGSFHSTEELFISGFYGPSCVYARATLEYILQEDCLAQEGKIDSLRVCIEKIKAPDQNPRIKDMRNGLVKCGVWPSETVPLSDTVIKNGDNIAHHRYDRIFKGKDLGSLRFQLPRVKVICDSNGNVVGMEQDGYYERLSHEINRGIEERQMSYASLESLMKILAICRPLNAGPSRNGTK